MKTFCCIALTAAALLFVAPAAWGADPAAIVTASGTVEPQSVVDVVAQVAGNIETFGADPQDANKRITYATHVTRGTILLQLDAMTFKAAVSTAGADLQRASAEVELARAQLDAAEVDLARLGKLPRDQAASAADMDSARAKLAVAQTKLEARTADVQKRQLLLQRAQADLDHCTIRSPVDGTILDLHSLNTGRAAMVNPGDMLFQIIDESKPYQIRTEVREKDISRVHAGQPVRFTVDAFPNKPFTGHVMQARSTMINANNEIRYTVLVEVSDNTGLLPYLTASVEIDVSDGK